MARASGRGELSPFPPGELARLAETVGADQVDAGAPLMVESEPVACVGVIHHGEVELHTRSRTRRVVLQVLHPGDVFGDIPFLCRMPAPFGARALTDVTVTRLDPGALWSVLDAHPRLCERFLFSMASRLWKLQQRLLELTAGDLRSQVATLLLDETGGDRGVIHLPQVTLAELLAATRPSVNGALKQLEREGAVRLGYRRIEVVDPDALRDGAASRR